MRDASRIEAYVVDVEDLDDSHRVALPRAATEDLTMHVAVHGFWHRRLPDQSATSCGIAYHSQFSPVRREDLCHPLCKQCFTHHELTIANARNEKEGR